nr:PREDICTED: uncharacterized protein LOC109033646 [Bemisia tabaci]
MPEMTSIKKRRVLLFTLLIFAQTLSQVESGRVKVRKTGKTSTDELHKLLRFVLTHDGCQQFTPLSSRKNPTFELSNDNCHKSCEIVNDLYTEKKKGQILAELVSSAAIRLIGKLFEVVNKIFELLA